ncbi:MAG: protein phosphatase 2C domain-containing protein [Lachnospiraceae bacterium]|nr:protein phosphatase 2C domain-containing protein [Lachnospiraceae bacterium]
MLISYGMSIVGSSHVTKNSPCQDSHCYQVLSNGWVTAAVADGVGSAKHSEIASKMACDIFIETCKEQITEDTKFSEAKKIIAEAYRKADLKIKEYVGELEDSITDYDTTLSAVIYDGRKLIYGHSGDGGIVALTYNGDYIKVTEPQKAEDGICVIPLRAGENHWEFGECEADVASVLLATDGVYDNFMPYLLKGQPVEFYIPLIRWFMDNNVIGITEQNRQEVEDSRRSFLCGDSCKSITDDKTVLVVFNADMSPKLKEDSYYAEPDWSKLQDIWNRKAYPHLYKDKSDDFSENDFKENPSQNERTCSDEVETDSFQNITKHSSGSDTQTNIPDNPVTDDTANGNQSKFFSIFKRHKK